MSRPIVWSATVLVSVALSFAGAGDRLAARFMNVSAPPPPQPAAATAVPAAPRIVTVAADHSGHFIIHPSLEGRRLRMVVDTGASLIALTHEDARLAGFNPARDAFTRRLSTANGVVLAAPVRIGEVRVGDIALRDVEAVVLPPGRLGTSLLGMSFLKRLAGFEVSRGRLTLRD